MTISVKVSGSYHTAQANVNVSGTWKLATLWTKVSGVWKQISALLSVSAFDISVNDSGVSSSHTTSGGTTITPSGSIGPYTYSTAYQSGDSSGSVTGGTTSTPTISKNFVGVPSSDFAFLDAVYRCTVTDGFGQSNYHDISVHLQYNRN